MNYKRKPIPGKLRHRVFERDNYRCRECGATNKETTLHVDHIKPVAKGGTNEIDNLQTLCEKCNLAKHTDEWVGGSISKRRNFKGEITYTEAKRERLIKKWEDLDSKLVYVQKQLPLAKTVDEQNKYINQITELNEQIEKTIKELSELKGNIGFKNILNSGDYRI